MATTESCISKVEGCLELSASNFDLNADKPCSDCCTYPALSLVLSQKVNGNNFTPGDTLLDRNGIPFRIRDLKYFLSSWTWKDDTGREFTIDSSSVTCSDNEVVYTPDIVLIDTGTFTYTLGTFRASPEIDSLTFFLGLVDALDCVDATRTDIPFVLTNQNALWDATSGSRADIKLVIQRDLLHPILDTLLIHTFRPIRMQYDVDFLPGKSSTLNVTVDYAAWFMQVDVHDINSFESSLLSGIQGSFSKTP